MIIRNLKDYLKILRHEKELIIIEEPVDPVLEATEIAIRALLQQKPALLFTKPIGSKFPLLMNTYASDRRVELALQRDPDELGFELIRFAELLMPPKFREIFSRRGMIKRFLSAFPKVGGSYSQYTELPVRLSDLPILKCWPNDGGRFITLPQVFTYDLITGKRNVGMYRMQVFDDETTGIHWQIQKGGGFHYHRAEKMSRDLPVAVALGTDPAMLFATIAALPENIDEVMFAGFLRGERTQLTKANSINILVPSYAEFILEGIVPANFRRMEGPFGDHFGHYSTAAEFPIFRIKKITAAKDPIYPATVVGIPPMEDKFLGDATQKILGPLIKLIHPEIESLWAYYEAGFHNLLVVSVDERHDKEAMKTAMSIMGEGQLSLTKCVITVDRGVNPRNFLAVLDEIKYNFDPQYDFIMIPKVPLDTLDFTSFKMNLGSKMIIDATSKGPARVDFNQGKEKFSYEQIKKILSKANVAFEDFNTFMDTLLVVKVAKDGRETIEKLVQVEELNRYKIIAVVSSDIDIFSLEKVIWGIFTRFDAERDIVFTEQKLVGISPIYRGIMGIDATWKTGYPEPLRMDEQVVKRVDEKWKKIFE